MLTSEQRDKLKELAGRGVQKAEIARRRGVSRSTVHRVLAGGGVTGAGRPRLYPRHDVPDPPSRTSQGDLQRMRGDLLSADSSTGCHVSELWPALRSCAP